MKTLKFAFPVAASIALSACSILFPPPPPDPDPDPDPDPPIVGIHPVATALSVPFADAINRCQGGVGVDDSFLSQIEPDGVPGQFAPDFAAFIAEYLDALIDAGGVVPNEDGVEGCASALELITCEELNTSFLPSACQDAMLPTQARGDSCFSPFECETGFCDFNGGGIGEGEGEGEFEQPEFFCGVCGLAPDFGGGPGEPDPAPPPPDNCFEFGCPDGQVCGFDEFTGDVSCQVPAQEGENCEFVECAEGLRCNFDNGNFPVCRALPGEGEDCQNFFECNSRDLVCDFEISGLCVPAPGLGELCPSFQCASDLICDEATQRCEELPGVGEPCPNFACAGEAQCVADFEREEVGVCLIVEFGFELGDRCTPLPFENTCGFESTLFSGLGCAGEPGAEVCVQAVVVGDGEVCDARDSRLDNGTRYCLNQLSTKACIFANNDDDTGLCGARPGPGDFCNQDLPCDVNSSFCEPFEFQNNGFIGECQPFAGLGQSCSQAQCGPGLFCDFDTNFPVCAEGTQGLEVPRDQIEFCLEQ